MVTCKVQNLLRTQIILSDTFLCSLLQDSIQQHVETYLMDRGLFEFQLCTEGILSCGQSFGHNLLLWICAYFLGGGGFRGEGDIESGAIFLQVRVFNSNKNSFGVGV